jgi:alpha-1,3-rhamnosyl/mannosyltransferase
MVPGEVGGSESWTMGLLGHLAEHPPPVEVVVFAPPSVLDVHPSLRRFEVVEAPAWIGPSRPARVAAEATWLAAAARRAKVSVLHHPGGTVPPVRLSPALVTVHDLQPLVHPEHFSALKRTYLRARLRPSVRTARLVTAVSEWTAGELRERLDVPDARLTVTPPAVDVDPPEASVPDLVERHHLDRPWFLYPAITYPHKDHATLVRALAQVPDVLLVLTGGAGPSEAGVLALAASLGVDDRVRRLGRIPFAHLDALYRGALACAFPSRFEAVGLPVLEAMARGCAVLAAEATALPSVVGAAGDLVPAGDADAWAAAMQRVASDDAHRAGLVAAGRTRARQWAPEASAAKLVAAWQRAAAG